MGVIVQPEQWLVIVWNKMKTALGYVLLLRFITTNCQFVKSISDINKRQCSRDYSDNPISGNAGIKAPWIAAVGIGKPNKEFTAVCSGSIITNKLILTAAFCFTVPRYQPTHVRVGANYINSIFTEDRKIVDKKIHPDYDSANRTYYFDIAILTVDEGFKFSSRISPICIPDTSSIHPGNGIGISVQGWVRDRGYGEVSQVSVTVRSKEECDVRFETFGNSSSPQSGNAEKWIPQLTTDVLFCADANLNADSGVCFGFSGGPAIQRKFIYGKSKYFLVGLVTGSINYCKGGLPDLYSFIGTKKILNWMDSVTVAGSSQED